VTKLENDCGSGRVATSDWHVPIWATVPDKGTTGQALVTAMQAAALFDLEFDLPPIRAAAPVRDIKF